MTIHSVKDFNVPSLPEIVSECIAELYAPEANFERIAELISQDIGLVASVLKLANSSAFSSSKPLSDLKTAMIRIGMTSVLQILINQSIGHIFHFAPIYFFNLRAFLEHSLQVSKIAFQIGKISNVSNLSDLLIAGIFHDIGIIGQVYLDELFAKNLIKYCFDHKVDFTTAEKHLNVISHAEIGFEILKRWNIPSEVCLFVRYYHTKENQRPRNITIEQNRNIHIITIADFLAHRFTPSFIRYHKKTYISENDLEKIKITSKDVKTILNNIKVINN